MSDEVNTRLDAIEKTCARMVQALESFQISVDERRRADAATKALEERDLLHRDHVSRTEDHLRRRDADLRQNEQAIADRERAVADRERSVEAREKALAQAKARMQSHLSEVA
jgi:hypothetical protein